MTDPHYPLTPVRFEVSWGGPAASFAEVSGLNVETDMIEYRAGNETPSVRKVPGLGKYSNVTMKRGVVTSGDPFFDWWTKNQQGQLERRDITIKLQNEAGESVVEWVVKQAWPVKVEGPNLNGKSNDVAIESIEFAHEGVTIKTS